MGHSRRNRQQRNSWATRLRIAADVEVEENESVNAAPTPAAAATDTRHCIQRTCKHQTQSTSLLPDPDLRFARRRLKEPGTLTKHEAARIGLRRQSLVPPLVKRVQSAQRIRITVPPPRSRLWRLALPPQLMILIRTTRLPISDCCWCAAAHAPAGGGLR